MKNSSVEILFFFYLIFKFFEALKLTTICNLQLIILNFYDILSNQQTKQQRKKFFFKLKNETKSFFLFNDKQIKKNCSRHFKIGSDNFLFFIAL